MTNEIAKTSEPMDLAALESWARPKTGEDALALAQRLSKAGNLPADYKRNPDNILLAMQFASELGLTLFQAMQNVSIINGRLSVWGDALLGLVLAHPECEDVVETFDQQTQTATCQVFRKGRRAAVVETFSKEDAKTAGLLGKKGPWQQYPRRMLKLRARGFALRDAFADALRGIITAEEAMDYPKRVEAKVIRTTKPAGVAAALEAVEAKPEPVADPVAELRKRLVDACLDAGFSGWGDCAPTVAGILGREITAETPPTLEEVEKVERELASEGSGPEQVREEDPQTVADFIESAKGGE